ncbi:hypothetical protein J2Y45_004028 [Dyadobacter sp. BE34]|uniref:Outer membrane protein beta-barrel domain-containing protein n=1 Tax=Dyadobacter fermentans TaxID=94254 RepID=A0ABU1R0B2_9BACT|nr:MULTISPECIES: hypothetical protein [Dyadobacter]MDR6806836.1 hypothetical protein [Dyadobacter fermentans]MDR7044578.1 hypothetical protein [Dyadobacter sp. BE242]MDR7198888.1 hypothetical protein [Dyadobacter sp. BE34]MDR7216850.1 hypothetical protein [Dyadobacter sp. BE31]MDR7263624.1 hypothetical protein [Dyadobacter sp. BE32]
MKTFISILICSVCIEAAAQTANPALNSKFISLTGGRSTHGTGDMIGVSQRVTYGQYFRKKLFWFSAVGADIHDGKVLSMTTRDDGTVLDHSYRYTSGAIQITGGVGWSILRTTKSELGVKVSGILRYQSSSYFDYLAITYDPQKIGPYPATFILHTSPQRTYAVGVGPEMFYQQSIFKSIFAGLSTGFQVDTNGDVLTNISLSIGKRIK